MLLDTAIFGSFLVLTSGLDSYCYTIPEITAMPTVVAIRHGQAAHNVAWDYLKHDAAYNMSCLSLPHQFPDDDFFSTYNCTDTSLTLKGIQQAQASQHFGQGIDAVLVSPLTRTLMTWEGIFGNRQIPTFALDMIKESSSRGAPPNHRKPKAELEAEWGPKGVNFTMLSEQDELWSEVGLETRGELKMRVSLFRCWFKMALLPGGLLEGKHKIAFVSHNDFIEFFMHESRSPEEGHLRQAYPYIVTRMMFQGPVDITREHHSQFLHDSNSEL